MVTCQAAAAEQGLAATALAAVAIERWILTRRAPGHGVVAPFAGQAVGPAQHAAVHGDARTGAGAQDHRKHHGCVGTGAVGGLAQRQAVGVVGQPHGLADGGLHVTLQRHPVQAGGVAVLHDAFRRLAARRADTHGQRLPAGRLTCLRHQIGQHLHRARVASHRRGHALAPQRLASGGEQHRLGLGAAQVDAQGGWQVVLAHPRSVPRTPPERVQARPGRAFALSQQPPLPGAAAPAGAGAPRRRPPPA